MTRRLLVTIDAGKRYCCNCAEQKPHDRWRLMVCRKFGNSWLNTDSRGWRYRLTECLAADHGEVEPARKRRDHRKERGDG